MFLYRPFLHYASADLQSGKVDQRSYACAAACVSVSRNIVHITGDMNRRGLLIGWFFVYTTFFAIMTLIFFVLENPSGATSADVLRDAYEGRDTLASLAKRSMAADRCTVNLMVCLYLSHDFRFTYQEGQSLFQQLQARLSEAGIPSSPPKKRQERTNDTIAESTLSAKAAEDYNRSAPDHNAGNHSQQLVLTRTQESEPGYDASAPHDASTVGYEACSGLVNDDLQTCPNDYVRSMDVFELPTLPRADYRATINPTQPCLTPTTPTSAGAGFEGISAMMFASADPYAYPKQPMSTIGNRNPIKVEDGQDAGWYGATMSSVDESAASAAQGFGAYVMAGQYPDASAVEQTIHPSSPIHQQDYKNFLTVSAEFASGPWPSPGADNLVGMNFHNVAAPEWASARMHHGYGP
jgi:hypothetical protein